MNDAIVALAALLIAAAPVDLGPESPARTAVLRQLPAADVTPPDCGKAEIAAAVAAAHIDQIGTLDGAPVVRVQFGGTCLNRGIATNGPKLIVWVSPLAKAPLLSTVAQSITVIGTENGLPKLRVSNSGSAYTSDIEIDVFRGGTYVTADRFQIRNDTGQREPGPIAVEFARGASSAQLAGTLWPRWGQTYTFRAFKGQRVRVDRVSATGDVFMYLGPPSHWLKPGIDEVFDRSGVFRLWLSSSGDRDVRYAFRLTIH